MKMVFRSAFLAGGALRGPAGPCGPACPALCSPPPLLHLATCPSGGGGCTQDRPCGVDLSSIERRPCPQASARPRPAPPPFPLPPDKGPGRRFSTKNMDAPLRSTGRVSPSSPPAPPATTSTGPPARLPPPPVFPAVTSAEGGCGKEPGGREAGGRRGLPARRRQSRGAASLQVCLPLKRSRASAMRHAAPFETAAKSERSVERSARHRPTDFGSTMCSCAAAVVASSESGRFNQ